MQTNLKARSPAPGTARRLRGGEALHLGRAPVELRVWQGELWLTRRGDLHDRLVSAGEQICVAARADAVIEPYDAAADVVVELVARSQDGRLVFFGAGLRRVMAATRFLGDLAAATRSAASSASRAHGRIASGDSIAASGALK